MILRPTGIVSNVLIELCAVVDAVLEGEGAAEGPHSAEDENGFHILHNIRLRRFLFLELDHQFFRDHGFKKVQQPFNGAELLRWHKAHEALLDLK